MGIDHVLRRSRASIVSSQNIGGNRWKLPTEGKTGRYQFTNPNRAFLTVRSYTIQPKPDQPDSRPKEPLPYPSSPRP